MPSKKTSSSKNKSARFHRFSNFNPIQLFALIAVFSFIGAFFIYQSQASPLTMKQLAAKYSCPWFFVPTATLRPNAQGPGKCPLMLKYILKNYAGAKTIKLDKNIYGEDAIKAVKTIQTAVRLTPNGIVGPKTWVVVQRIYLIGTGQYSAPTSPTPPPNAYIGARPGFSGRLSEGEEAYFNDQWPKWNTVGWCVIGHESHAAGDYKTANGDGAFQIIKSTWNNPANHPVYPSEMLTNYTTASSAPPDVQWDKFFHIYKDGAGGSNWHGTYWMSYSLANHIGSARFVGSSGQDLGPYQSAPNHPAGAIACPHT